MQVSFGVAPAFAAFALGLRLPLDTLVLTVFACAGIARLARFNVTAASVPHDAKGKARYFEGLPIPSSLALVIGMGVCLALGRFEDANGPWLPSAVRHLYTGSLRSSLPFANAAHGVPFGVFSCDVGKRVYAALTHGPLSGLVSTSVAKSIAKHVGVFAIHKISFLWLAWSMAMVSKTLHVPKP